jgi:PPM family protein phosphatase
MPSARLLTPRARRHARRLVESVALGVPLDVGSATDVGRVRDSNEDALLTLDASQDGSILVAVADGMGGHNAGEVASAIAIESLSRFFEAPADLGEAVVQANEAIWDAACADLEKEGMGTTLVCALVAAEGEVTIANVGDSRAYAVADGEARLVTVDHTWVTDQVRSGQLSEDEARHSPYRHLLTRSLGATPRVKVDVFSDLRLRLGDALVLCSDGVTTYLEPTDVAQVLSQSHTAQQAAERLVKLAVRRGGADNATAVVVRRA